MTTDTLSPRRRIEGRGLMGRPTLAAGLLGAVLLVLGCGPLRSLAGDAESGELPTLRVGRETLTESTVAIGTVQSQVGAEVKVGSQLSGIVARLAVKVGDQVVPGDLLAALRADDWQARVAALKAEVAVGRAELDYAESELARVEQMPELVPALEIDSRRRSVKVRRAEVERRRANLAEAEITLGYSVIRAPVAGTVASVATYEGETVAASLAAPTFVTLVDLDRLEVQSYVDETDIGRVAVGQRVSVRVDSFPGRELAGVVRAIYPKARLVNNVVNYVVIVDLVDQLGLLLRPEMTVHVTFVLDRREEALVVPRAALLQEGGRSFVLVRDGEGWLERTVTVGLQTSQRIEIVAGIEEGEVVMADKLAWKQRTEIQP